MSEEEGEARRETLVYCISLVVVKGGWEAQLASCLAAGLVNKRFRIQRGPFPVARVGFNSFVHIEFRGGETHTPPFRAMTLQPALSQWWPSYTIARQRVAPRSPRPCEGSMKKTEPMHVDADA